MITDPFVVAKNLRAGDTVKVIHASGERTSTETGELYRLYGKLALAGRIIVWPDGTPYADIIFISIEARTDWRVGDRCVRRDTAGPVETISCVFPFTTRDLRRIDGGAGAGHRNVDISEYIPVIESPMEPTPVAGSLAVFASTHGGAIKRVTRDEQGRWGGYTWSRLVNLLGFPLVVVEAGSNHVTIGNAK